MKVSSILARNVKGYDFSHRLSPVNLITGPDNFCGKTAVMEAIRVSLVGHHPRLGKQPSATMKLAGDLKQEMEIIASFGNQEGDPVARHLWKRKKDGGASYESESPLDTPVVLLDIRDYFNRTAADRIKFVVEKIDSKKLGFNDQTIFDRVKKIEMLPIAVANKAIQAIEAKITESIKVRDVARLSLQRWMDDLIKSLKDTQSDLAKEAKQFAAEITALRSQILPTPPVDVAADLDKANTAYLNLVENTTAIRTRLESRAQNAGRIKELEAIVANPVQEPRQLRVELETIESQLNAEQPREREMEAKLSGMRVTDKNLRTTKQDLQTKYNDLQLKIDTVKTHTCCPTCTTKNEGWKDNWILELGEQQKKVWDEITELGNKITDLVKEGKALAAEQEQLVKTIGDLKSKRANLKAGLQTENDRFARYTAAVDELKGLNAIPTGVDPNELAAKEAELLAAKQRVDDLQSKATTYQQFKELTKRRDEVETKSIEKSTFSEVYKKAVAELVALLEEQVQTAFGGILDKTRTITDGILPAPLEYRDGELGMQLDLGWACHETFSGTEIAIAYAAFCVALAQDAPVKIVLIDELDVIKVDRRILLLERMLQLTESGVIDQFVGISIGTPPELIPAGVNVINVG